MKKILKSLLKAVVLIISVISAALVSLYVIDCSNDTKSDELWFIIAWILITVGIVWLNYMSIKAWEEIRTWTKLGKTFVILVMLIIGITAFYFAQKLGEICAALMAYEFMLLWFGVAYVAFNTIKVGSPENK